MEKSAWTINGATGYWSLALIIPSFIGVFSLMFTIITAPLGVYLGIKAVKTGQPTTGYIGIFFNALSLVMLAMVLALSIK